MSCYRCVSCYRCCLVCWWHIRCLAYYRHRTIDTVLSTRATSITSIEIGAESKVAQAQLVEKEAAYSSLTAPSAGFRFRTSHMSHLELAVDGNCNCRSRRIKNKTGAKYTQPVASAAYMHMRCLLPPLPVGCWLLPLLPILLPPLPIPAWLLPMKHRPALRCRLQLLLLRPLGPLLRSAASSGGARNHAHPARGSASSRARARRPSCPSCP
jgi:hypothetical protein